jgi:hypothetical protein
LNQSVHGYFLSVPRRSSFWIAGLAEAKNPAGKALRLIQTSEKVAPATTVNLRNNWEILPVF